MPLHPSLTFFRRLFFASIVGLAAPAFADGRAGDFDFYVLSLSWTPAVCASFQADAVECAAPHAFLVHGFWPEYEAGHPEFCDADQPQSVKQATLDAIADLIPSASFANYQWRKHGLCSGLGAQDYFGKLKSAAAKVAIPAQFRAGGRVTRTTPGKVEAAFVSANPGLAASGIAVRCADNTLTEVRICLTKDLAYRPCAAVNADTCRASSISVQAP